MLFYQTATGKTVYAVKLDTTTTIITEGNRTKGVPGDYLTVIEGRTWVVGRELFELSYVSINSEVKQALDRVEFKAYEKTILESMRAFEAEEGVLDAPLHPYVKANDLACDEDEKAAE